MLVESRINQFSEILTAPFISKFYRDRTPDLSAIEVPVLSAGNWGGLGLHLRGNVEGFKRVGSQQKWLEMHGNEHWADFYTDRGRKLQLEFFDHFLKGEDNGWPDRPPVMIRARTLDGGFVDSTAQSWPPADVRWQRLILGTDLVLAGMPSTGAAEFDAHGAGVTFMSEPLPANTELCGPVHADLNVSSSTEDADLFLSLRIFDVGGNEVRFAGANGPGSPCTAGWLRISHRSIDEARSTSDRPFYLHQEELSLGAPGTLIHVVVELLPTSVLLPAGSRIALTIQGHGNDQSLALITHPDDGERSSAAFAGKTTLHLHDQGCSVTLPFRDND